MVQSSSPLVLLIALAFFATASLAAETCPNKCLRPKSLADRQCREGALSTLCAVKKCPDRRGWKCAKRPQILVKCKPVAEVGGRHCGQGPLCEMIPPLADDERSTEIGCRCGSRTSFSSADELIGKGMNRLEFRCYVDCMKIAACLRGACTAEPAPAGALDPCDEKTETMSKNVRSKRNQRKCCEECGFSHFLRSEPGLRDSFVCGSA